MAATYRIDPAGARIFSTLEGVVTDQELIRFQQQLLADPAFEPNYSQLTDYTGITCFDVSSQTMRSLALPNILAKGVRLAIVARSEFIFGMARMYQLLREGIAEEIRVFRDLNEAYQWLDWENGKA
jgi:hypothetical protein